MKGAPDVHVCKGLIAVRWGERAGSRLHVLLSCLAFVTGNWRRKRRSCFGRNDFLSPFSGNGACHSMSCWTEDHKRFMHF